MQIKVCKKINDVLNHIILLLNLKTKHFKAPLHPSAPSIFLYIEYQVFSSHFWSTTKTSTFADLWSFSRVLTVHPTHTLSTPLAGDPWFRHFHLCDSSTLYQSQLFAALFMVIFFISLIKQSFREMSLTGGLHLCKLKLQVTSR